MNLRCSPPAPVSVSSPIPKVRVMATKAVSGTAEGAAHLVISPDYTPGKATGIDADGEYLNLVTGSFAATPELSVADTVVIRTRRNIFRLLPLPK